jgi:hypothetical protein
VQLMTTIAIVPMALMNLAHQHARLHGCCIDGRACVASHVRRFYCQPQREYLRSNLVNDGVCDCCDGSDETLISSSHVCRNACEAIAQAHREHDAK